MLPLIFFFILGTIFASFINVVIDRYLAKKSVLKGRSVCEDCNKKLGPADLIPLVSYLFLKGKCRYCRSKIPFRIFLVELLGGLLLAGLYFSIGLSNLVAFVILGAVIFVFVAIFFIDIYAGLIPNHLTLVLSFFGFLYSIFSAIPFMQHLFSAIVSLLFFLLLFLLTKGKGIGFGDVKLSFSLGLLLPYPLIIIALYMAFILGAIVSVSLVMIGKKKLKGGSVPFGPFLVTGAISTLLFKDFFINVFLLLFNIQ